MKEYNKDMKNHFIFGYFGNKREEVEIIWKFIHESVDTDSIRTIIEPFAGTSALSYYISTLYPKKFKYILNDINSNLIELYRVLQSEKDTESFVKLVNSTVFTPSGEFIDKPTYVNIVKKNDLLGWFIANKYGNIRPGMYPVRSVKPISLDSFNKSGIIHFLRTENVVFESRNAIPIIKEYGSADTLMFIDPPYLMAHNDFYDDRYDVNIYEYLVDNTEVFINCFFALENNWIVRMMLRGMKQQLYSKKYTSTNKRAVVHSITHISCVKRNSN